MSSVDSFIERAERICEKFRRAPAFALKARREGRALLKQFEEYLKARGLEAPARARRGLKAAYSGRQHRSRV